VAAGRAISSGRPEAGRPEAGRRLAAGSRAAARGWAISSGRKPGGGSRLGDQQRPEAGRSAAGGQKPGDQQRAAARGRKPGGGSRPEAGSRAARGRKPGGGSRLEAGRRLAAGRSAAAGSRAISSGRPEAGRSAAAGQSAAGSDYAGKIPIKSGKYPFFACQYLRFAENGLYLSCWARCPAKAAASSSSKRGFQCVNYRSKQNIRFGRRFPACPITLSILTTPLRPLERNYRRTDCVAMILYFTGPKVSQPLQSAQSQMSSSFVAFVRISWIAPLSTMLWRFPTTGSIPGGGKLSSISVDP